MHGGDRLVWWTQPCWKWRPVAWPGSARRFFKLKVAVAATGERRCGADDEQQVEEEAKGGAWWAVVEVGSEVCGRGWAGKRVGVVEVAVWCCGGGSWVMRIHDGRWGLIEAMCSFHLSNTPNCTVYTLPGIPTKWFFSFSTKTA